MNPLTWLFNRKAATYQSIQAWDGDDDGDGIPRAITNSSANLETYWAHYKSNPLVRAAVVEAVHALIGIPLQAEQYDTESKTWLPLPPSDRLQSLLRRPSRTVAPSVFWGRLYTDLGVTGNLAAFKRRNPAQEIVELRRIVPGHYYPISSADDEVAGFVYDPARTYRNGRDIAVAASKERPSSALLYRPQSIVHVPVDTDPDYDLMGLSPIASALKYIDLHNAIGDFTRSVMERGAVMDHALITKQHVSDAEVRRIERRWFRRRSGPKNAGGLVVVDGTEATLERMGLALSGREMGLTDLEKQVEALVLMALDVPPILVGAVVGMENATYSNYAQARLGFHEESTDPNMWRLCSTLEHSLADDFPEHRKNIIRIRPDLSHVMALLEWEDKRRRLALAEFAGGVTTQTEARGAVDRPALDGGNFYALPLNMQRIEPGTDIVTAAEQNSAQGGIADSRAEDLAKALGRGDYGASIKLLAGHAVALGVPNEVAAHMAENVFATPTTETRNRPKADQLGARMHSAAIAYVASGGKE